MCHLAHKSSEFVSFAINHYDFALVSPFWLDLERKPLVAYLHIHSASIYNPKRRLLEYLIYPRLCTLECKFRNPNMRS